MKELDGEYISFSFSGNDLSFHNLSGTFVDCDFTDTNLNGARLIGKFVNCDFTGADLHHTFLHDGDFTECRGLGIRGAL